MRDALSLLDQAIAHGNGEVLQQTVAEMLGTIDSKEVAGIVQALINHDAADLLHQVERLATHGVVFSAILAELVSVFHQLAIAQAVPDVLDEDDESLLALAGALTAEDVQLYYQIALMGQKDLPLAPDPRAGFEMILLRMYAFQPDASEPSPSSSAPKRTLPVVNSKKKQPPESRVAPAVKQQPASSVTEVAVKPRNELAWDDVVSQLPLSGLSQQLASHSVFVEKDGSAIKLMLSSTHAHLGSDKIRQRLQEALGQFYGEAVRVSLVIGQVASDTPAKKQQTQEKQALDEALREMENDPHVIAMKQAFNAELDPKSIKLLPKSCK
ncbi:MAG TPA: hypothetical protein ENK06_14350 [Gammaproteobacteria bacterium]|nr:hypothetical protein [Gammaproteobacteria bacterium]